MINLDKGIVLRACCAHRTWTACTIAHPLQHYCAGSDEGTFAWLTLNDLLGKLGQ